MQKQSHLGRLLAVTQHSANTTHSNQPASTSQQAHHSPTQDTYRTSNQVLLKSTSNCIYRTYMQLWDTFVQKTVQHLHCWGLPRFLSEQLRAVVPLPQQKKTRIWFYSYKQITRISKRVTHEDNVTRTWFQNARQPARSQSFLIQPTAFSRCNTQTHRPLHLRGGACIHPPVVPVAIHCESTPAASLLEVFCFSLGESIPHI